MQNKLSLKDINHPLSIDYNDKSMRSVLYIHGFKVSNINNRPNQYIIDTPYGQFFQSYKTLISYKDNNDQVYLDENYWDYSSTTGKYRNIFLNENKRLTQKKIDHSIYILTNLNREKWISNNLLQII